MQDPGLVVRTGYFDLLNGMTVGSATIPVFDYAAPYPEAVPYIVIEEIMSLGANTKSSFATELTIDLLVYTAYNGDFGGRKQADEIANALLELAIPTPGQAGIAAEGFNVTSAKLLGNTDDFTRGTKSTYAKRITISHTIYQQ